MKNPRASRALRRALDPGHLNFTLFALLRFAPSANLQKGFLGPPDHNPGSATVICVIYSCLDCSTIQVHHSTVQPFSFTVQNLTHLTYTNSL